jgi:hypothetical protein
VAGFTSLVGAEDSRPVRIVRRVGVPPVSVGEAAPIAPAVGNRAGLRRAQRLRSVYLGLLAAAYALVIVMMAASPYAGVRTDVPVYALLSVVAAGSAILGYVVTIGRAPWAVYVDEGMFVVRERFGSVRRFPIDGGLEIRVVARHPVGPLSPEATETVRVKSGTQAAREYVLPSGLVTGFPGLAGRISR